MIMITGQKAIMTAKQARFQIVDVVASMRPLTKMTRQIVSAADASRRSCAMPSGSRWKSGRARCIWSCRRTSPARRSTTCRRLPLHPLERPVAHPGGARPRGRDDPGGQAPADHDRRGRQPAARWSRRCRTSCAHAASRSSTRRWARARSTGGSNLYMGTAALSERDYVHEADRPRRPDHRHRP